MLSAMRCAFSEAPPTISIAIGAVTAVEKLKHLRRHPAEPPHSRGISFSQGSSSGQQSECIAETVDPDAEA
jgi:hypothetical protein